MRILDFALGTIVDGPGLRTSIYFAGCSHCCPGCHNPQSWPFDAGKEMCMDDVLAVVEENGFNVTLTGGDPLYQIDEIIPLCQALRGRGYSIWCYTGYTFEEICASPSLCRILDCVEAIVDGPFVQSQSDISLRFRGSSNQRIIDCRQSKPGKPVIWQG